jgi:hypothetical protein
MSSALFNPERFTLDPSAKGWELDQEVAAIIANEIYCDDTEGQAGNNYADPDVIIDPTGKTFTRSLARNNEENPEESWAFRISFHADDSSDNLNGAFATQVKSALFEGERQNASGLKGSLAMTGVIVGGPAILTAAALETDVPTLITVGMIGGAALMLTGLGKTIPQNFYRLYLTKPDSLANRRKLQAVAQMAESLKLPPVVIPPR